MKTFTTCAEKKAKQFFNLLQGYTKGIRIIAVLTLLLTMGVGQVWAYVNASAYVYFDPNDKWNYTNYYFASIQETGNWQTKTYKLSNITNTKLYYLSTTAHNDAGFISFGGQNGTFNGGYWGYDSFKSYITMCGEKCNWGLNYQNTYLFYPSANTKGTSLNPQYLGGGFNDLNSEQTIKTVVDGTVANSKATISITSYKMTGNGTATEQTATLGTGAKDSYITAARTATTTLTVGTIEAGYQFDGWYTAATGGTQLSTSTTYTYYPTAATTVYARFSTKQHTVLFGKQGNGTITAKIENTSISSGNKVNYGSEVVFTAIPSTGYQIEGWYSNSACTTPIDNGTNETYTVTITGGTNVYVKFEEIPANSHNITYTEQGTGWTYGNSNPTTAEEGATVTFLVNPTTGYNVNVTSSDATITGPNASNEYSFTMPNKDVTINVSATEKLTTVTLNVSSGGGSFTVDDTSYTSGSTVKVGVATSYIVKAIANTGYTFDKWTQGGNASAKGSGNSVTLKGNGNGETGTLNAYFNRTYAFIQGRFRVNSASRNQMTYTYDDGHQWKENSTNIQMEYDDTNSRFYLHTYMKPKELTETHGTGCNDCKPYFYIKTSTSSSSLVNTISYQSTTSQTLTTAGTSGKKELAISGGSNANLRFDTQDESGYVVLYFDEQYIWYELEYRLDYNANGGTGTAPSRTYHFSGTNITAKPANTFTREGYTFTGWNTAEDGSGTSYAAGASVTINKNTTLYAQWRINTKDIYLVGEFNWDTADENKFTETSSGSGIYKLTKQFDARDRHQTTTQSQAEYEFKLNVDGTNYTVEGNTDYTQADKKILQYTRQSTTKVVSDGTNYQSDPYHNLLLQADMTGDYIFTYNAETKELTVTHPTYTPEASFIVGDFSDGATGTDALPKDGGAGHDWTEAYGQQFGDGNSTTICFNGTNQTWEFKIKINGVWYGLKDLVITESGTYTLTNEYAYQSERNCAITTNGVNGCYEFSWIDKGNGTINLTVGYPEPNNYPTTVYLKPNDDWKANNARFAVYYWDDENNNAWKDMTDVGCNGEYYQVEIPAAQVGIILCSMKGSTTTNDWNNKVYQTEDLYVPSDHKVLYDMESTNITHIYLTPNSNWKKDGAQFEAVFNDNSYKRMEKFDNNGTIYYCQSESGQVKFNRVNPNDGYIKWNYTHTLSIPTDGKNLYTITEGAWNEGDGSWSTIYDNSKWTTYTAPTYDVTINITGKGSVTIDGETYESTSEGTTTLTIEDLDVNTVKNVTAITPADRWDYQNNATIKIGNNDQATLACQNHTICGPTTINITFIQVQCLVSFDLNLPEGAEHIGIGEQIITKGDTATEPATRTINGYMFGGWYTEAECTNKYDFSTAVTKDITLYARWAPYEECIFFKNNLNWNKIYIYTFNNEVWHNGNNQDDENDDMGVQPKINRIEFGQMTQIGYTDIYYYVLTKEDGFNRIAFSDYDMSGYNYFNKHSGIYRGDRQDHMQLFIPQKDQTPKKRNETQYYSSGLWMKYNSTYSGYDWSGQTTGSDWSHTQFTTDVTGGYSFTAEVPLTVGTNYEFKIWNINQDWYGNGGTMTQDNCTNWHFKTEDGSNAKITPTITGDYVFTVYLGDGKVMISLDYPLSVGDYRLAYQDNTHPFHPGHYIKKRSTIAEQRDTVSFFVHHDQSPKIYLQQCTAISAEGVPTWETQTTYTELGDAVSSTTVYNFVLKQTNSGDTHTCSVETGETHLYTGEFYIRTDAAGGGWKSFRQSGNKMTFSSYAQQNEHFDHYFCEWILAKENVKFTIANDYSYCISDTLDNDDIIEHDDVSTGCLPVDANVRFSWNSANNEIHRAYIAGSSYVADRFLVLEGNEYLKDDEGNILPAGEDNGSDPRYGLNIHEEVFGDMGNWIYQVDVTADVQTKAKLTALYNGVVQYFKGKEGDGDDAKIALLKSTATDTYKIRLIYDFKTNHLVSGWLIEDDTVEEDNAVLGANMMIIRHNQDPAEQLNFDPNSRTLTDVGIAYGVMTFDKYFLNNRAEDGSHLSDADKQSPYARALYWISFPFDVKLSEVFGFGEYGDYWIMEYYDGAARAKNGLWADTDTYWKYITNKNYILQKGQGYVISLNLNKMGFESNIFDNTDTVSLYFPSHGELGTITGVPTNYEVPAHECTIEREDSIHIIYDSHWNVIGVPGFADIENVEIGDHLFTQDSIHFYYEYLPQTNEYRTRRAGGNKTPANFQTMYSYMVQYYGGINWSTKTFTGPSAIAARRTGEMPSQYDLRLELAIDDQLHDQTFILLDEDKRATAEYDVNLDLTKIMNKNASIYTLAGEQRITLSGNTLPMEKATVPVGVRVATAGEYTFRMPDGTDGITVTLVDNATGTHTNMLMDEYTVTLDAGTIENRFYLVVDPDRTATSVENIGEEAKGEEAKDQIKKFLIDGQLFIRTADGTFDAKGQRL